LASINSSDRTVFLRLIFLAPSILGFVFVLKLPRYGDCGWRGNPVRAHLSQIGG
jgi:hypothetical protein